MANGVCSHHFVGWELETFSGRDGTGRDEEAMGKIRADERLRGRLLEDNFHLNRTEYYLRRGKPRVCFFSFFQ